MRHFHCKIDTQGSKEGIVNDEEMSSSLEVRGHVAASAFRN